MSRFIYVNGRYQRYHSAQIHVEDRGFQFADAVYEVIEVRDGKLVDFDRHDQRLRWSLAQLDICEPMSRAALALVMAKIVRLNRVRHGLVYLQVTRGQAKRDFFISNEPMTPSLIILARPGPSTGRRAEMPAGTSVVTRPDPRWARCDIKTVMLLPASLEKTRAKRAHGAQEVWFVDDDDLVIEGGSSTAWIVDASGTLRTRSLSEKLLPGVTRSTVLDIIAELGLSFEERAFSLDEAKLALEAFNTAASVTISPVTTVNGQLIGDGKPGPMTRKLREIFHQIAERSGRGPMQFPPM
ncbi:MAG: D-amino-acid transaminase [Pseudomonadota bacterium]